MSIVILSSRCCRWRHSRLFLNSVQNSNIKKIKQSKVSTVCRVIILPPSQWRRHAFHASPTPPTPTEICSVQFTSPIVHVFCEKVYVYRLHCLALHKMWSSHVLSHTIFLSWSGYSKVGSLSRKRVGGREICVTYRSVTDSAGKELVCLLPSNFSGEILQAQHNASFTAVINNGLHCWPCRLCTAMLNIESRQMVNGGEKKWHYWICHSPYYFLCSFQK